MFSKLLSDIPSDRIYKIIFLIGVSIIAFFNHISTAMLGFDDAFFAQKAKEMVSNRDWFYIFPTHGGELNFDNKPPVLFWILSLAGLLFGFSNWGMRFFPALFGVLSVMVLFFLAISLSKSDYFAFLSAFILLFTQQFIYYSRSATPESLYTLLWLLSLWCFKKALEENYNFLYLCGGVLVGVAVMTRNVPALLIYIVFVIYALFIGKLQELRTSILFYVAIVITFVIAAPWHIAMIVLHKESFVRSYFGVIVRYAFLAAHSDWLEYFKKILGNYWPWLPFLIISIYHIVKGFPKKTSLEAKVTPSLAKKSILFIFSVVISYYALIQISKIKAPQYLVPLYPFMALLSAEGLIMFDKTSTKCVSKVLIGIGILLALLWSLFPILPNTLDSKEFSQLVKMKDVIRQIKSPIYTSDSPDLWHFRNGLLFYVDKNVFPVLDNTTAILQLNDSNAPPYYFIIKKRWLKNYFDNRLKDNVHILAETSESVLFANEKGWRIFQEKIPRGCVFYR